MQTHRLRPALAILLVLPGCPSSPGTPDGGERRDAPGSDAPSAVDAPSSGDGGPGDAGVERPLVRSTDFAEATDDVRNADRGMYWWDWNEDAALVLVKVQLGDWCATPTLPASVATDLSTRLDGHRTGGRRAIVRFVYADDGDLNACGLADAESLAIVLGHVAQLAEVMDENADVIAFVEAGFFGMWGEWNSEHAPAGTSLWDDEGNRRQLLAALVDAFPAERPILVRRPRFRDEVDLAGVDVSRIGFHNDCFLASATDYGTYDGARTVEEWKDYVHAATAGVPIGGETCLDDVTYTACTNALAEMERLRFSYVHEGYNADVIARWDTEGCLPEIRARLGYRIVLRAVEAPAALSPGETLRVRLELENVGFAPPYSSRRLRLVLRSGAESHVLTPTGTGTETRDWLPGAPIVVDVATTLPADVAAGDWELRVVLLEDRSDLPAYAMLFANDDRVRDDVLRENLVARLAIR